jgi:NTP pyrophosphatase (non-canonical NTP hydrolase)
VSTGHELAREIIAKHGKDRYPDAGLALLKVMEELGELVQAYLRGDNSEHVRKEYGDVGIALYALGDRLGLNLDDEMHLVVSNETRRFT